MPEEFIEYAHAPGVPTLKLTTRKMAETEKASVEGAATREQIQREVDKLRDRRNELIHTLGEPISSRYVEELLVKTWRVIEYLNERLP